MSSPDGHRLEEDIAADIAAGEDIVAAENIAAGEDNAEVVLRRRRSIVG
jgi:hypothetical protein